MKSTKEKEILVRTISASEARQSKASTAHQHAKNRQKSPAAEKKQHQRWRSTKTFENNNEKTKNSKPEKAMMQLSNSVLFLLLSICIYNTHKTHTKFNKKAYVVLTNELPI